MSSYLRAALLFWLLVLVVAAVVSLFPTLTKPVGVPSIDWVYIPPVVPNAAPFGAWFSFASLGESTSELSGKLVQLRICDATNECVLGERKAVAEGGTGYVTAARALPPGEYSLELLVLARDVLGVVRTVATVARQVSYGE